MRFASLGSGSQGNSLIVDDGETRLLLDCGFSARATVERLGRLSIAAEDIEPDFKLKVLGKNRKIDIAIFKPGQPHTEDNLYRAVVVEKEPKIGTKGAYRMRDPEEARKEFELLEAVMAEVESCDYGLWTNGLEFFFFKKEITALLEAIRK